MLRRVPAAVWGKEVTIEAPVAQIVNILIMLLFLMKMLSRFIFSKV